MSNTDIYREFVACVQEEKRVKADLARIREVKKTLTDDILDAFIEDGVSQMRLEVDGGTATIFPHETLRARALEGDNERLNEALREHGFGDLIKEAVNSQTLSAFVREQLADNQLPPSIKSALDVYADSSVRVTQTIKGGSASSRALRNLNS